MKTMKRLQTRHLGFNTQLKRRLPCSFPFSTSQRFLSDPRSRGDFLTDLTAFGRITHGVTPLNSYGIIEVSGRDCESFLQGMISNDIRLLNKHDYYHSNSLGNLGLYSGILSPQGRLLYDVLISKTHAPNAKTHNENVKQRIEPPESSPPSESQLQQQSLHGYFLECDKSQTENIINYLQKYKLRAKVNFHDKSNELRVWSLMTNPKNVKNIFSEYSSKHHNNDKHSFTNHFYIDPRCDHLGMRVILDKNNIPSMINDAFAPIGEDFYDNLKMLYGVPKFGSELIHDKSIILESNFQHMNGISFNKGCYVGQELMARTHHRGYIRKRLFPARIVKKEKLNFEATKVRKLDFEKEDLNRETIFPQWFIDEINENKESILDFEKSLLNGKDGISIISENKESNRSIGKIYSNSLHQCMVQLRNDAFFNKDENNKDEYWTHLSLKSNEKDGNSESSDLLKVDWNEYALLPHLPPYMHNLHEILTRNQD